MTLPITMNDSLTTKTYRYDVFVSYSQANAAWVWRWLRPRLKAAGLDYCIDRESFELGAPRLDEIERAVSESRHVLVILSPDWVESEWNSFEATLVQHTDPAARFRKLIPVLLEPCEPPERIQLLHWVDLTEAEARPAQLERVTNTIQGIDTLPELRTDAYPDAKSRRRELRWYMIGAVSALMTLFLLLAWFWTELPDTTMPIGNFNIAVAPFNVIDANGEDIDHEAGIEQANSIANVLASEQSSIQQVLGAQQITVWGPDRVSLVREGEAETVVNDLKAKVLLYGNLRKTDKGWQLQPKFYLNHEVIHQADELQGTYALGTAIDYYPNDQPSVRDTNKILQVRLDALTKLFLGLSYYARGNQDGYKGAIKEFEEAAKDSEWGAAGEKTGQEILYLFLGNAYLKQSAYLNDEPTSRAELLSQSQEAYKEAINLNQDYARSYNGLGSVLYQSARPLSLGTQNDCAWDWEKLDLAGQMYENALKAPTKPSSGSVELRANLGLGRIDLTKSHCKQEDNWAEAQAHYEQAINKYEEKTDKSYLNHLAMAAYTELAFIVLGQAAKMESTTGQPHELPTEVKQYYQRAAELAKGLRANEVPEESHKYLDIVGGCVNSYNGTALVVWQQCVETPLIASANATITITLESSTPIATLTTILIPSPEPSESATPLYPVAQTVTPSLESSESVTPLSTIVQESTPIVSDQGNEPPTVIQPTLTAIPPTPIVNDQENEPPTATPPTLTTIPPTPILQAGLPQTIFLSFGGGGGGECKFWRFGWSNRSRDFSASNAINLNSLESEPTIQVGQYCDNPDQNATFTLTIPNGDTISLDSELISLTSPLDQQKYPNTSYTLPYDASTGLYTLSVEGDHGTFSQAFRVIKESGKIEFVSPTSNTNTLLTYSQDESITVNYFNFTSNDKVEVGLYEDKFPHPNFELLTSWQITVNELGEYSEELSPRLNRTGNYYLFACTFSNCYSERVGIDKRGTRFRVVPPLDPTSTPTPIVQGGLPQSILTSIAGTSTRSPTTTITNTITPTATVTDTSTPTATVTITPTPTATVTNTMTPMVTETFTPLPPDEEIEETQSEEPGTPQPASATPVVTMTPIVTVTQE